LLLESCGTIEDEVLLKLAVATGIRRGDITAIKIINVELEHGSITYYEKKKKRMRTVFISSPLNQLIGKFLKTIPKRELLFSFKDRQAYNRLNNLCVIAGIPKRPFHALRATCVKFAQRAGWSPEQVSELTGDTIKVIQMHYATPTIQEMAEVSKERPII